MKPDYKKCLRCKKEFIPNTFNQVYCCKECNKATYEEKYYKNKEITYFQIFKRDNFRCIYCGKSVFKYNIELVIDHIEPRKNGIDNNVINLVTSCRECNKYKSHIPLSSEIVEEIKLEILKKTLEHKLEYAKIKDYFDKQYNPKK